MATLQGRPPNGTGKLSSTACDTKSASLCRMVCERHDRTIPVKERYRAYLQVVARCTVHFRSASYVDTQHLMLRILSKGCWGPVSGAVRGRKRFVGGPLWVDLIKTGNRHALRALRHPTVCLCAGFASDRRSWSRPDDPL